MNHGYIKLHRKIKNNWLWQEKRKFSKYEAWIDLLFKANFTEGNKFVIKNDLITQRRGDIITSQTKLSEEWRWNIKSVKKFLELLKKDKMVEIETTSHYTRVFILNYDKHNPVSKLYDERDAILNGEQSTKGDLGKGIQGVIINNDNNYKNEKNGNKQKETASQSRAYKKEEVNEIFSILEEVNPNLERGNTTEREAAAVLISRLGFEDAKASAKTAVIIHGQPYAPVIISPTSLRKKYGDMVAYLKRNQNSRTVSI